MHQGLFGISKSRNSVRIHQYFLWAVKMISGRNVNIMKKLIIYLDCAKQFMVCMCITAYCHKVFSYIQGICTQMTNTLNIVWIGNLLSGKNKTIK